MRIDTNNCPRGARANRFLFDRQECRAKDAKQQKNTGHNQLLLEMRTADKGG